MTGADLKKFLDALVADKSLFPVYDSKGLLLKTFCNLAAQRCGPGEPVIPEFSGLMADQIYDLMVSANWPQVSGVQAAAMAQAGRRVFGAMRSDRMKEHHGHIVRIYPAPTQKSGSLGRGVPLCANIGKGDITEELSPKGDGTYTRPNWVCKTSQAFPVTAGECVYFVHEERPA
jgi:hypothetical protein